MGIGGGARPAARAALALAVFGAAAVAFTWPVAQDLRGSLAGDGADAHLFVWNHWWFAKALSAGENPYATTMVYWPAGTSLALHTLAPALALAAWPLAAGLGHVGAYNVLLIATFALAAWGAWLLARDVTGREAPAWIAGFAYGFLPYHYAHALGHLNLVAYFWIPFFLLAFRRWLDGGAWRHLAGATAALVGAALTDYALAMMVGLLALAYTLAVRGWRDRAAWKRLLAPGALGGLLLSPLLLTVVDAYRRAPDLAAFSVEATRFSLDVFSYAFPTPFSTAYADVGRVLVPDGTMTEGTAFLGYGVLALAVLGVALAPRRETRAWLLVAAAFYVLSLGPRLFVAGADTGVPMPYLVFTWLPLLDTLRTPARFAVLVSLAVAMLAALGAREALGRWRPRPAALRGGAVALACAVVLAESVVLPFPALPFRTTDLYADAAALEPEALVELPLLVHGHGLRVGRIHYLSAQATHGLPLVNGYTARETARDLQFLKGELVLSWFARLELGNAPLDARDVFPDVDVRASAGDLLASWGLRAVLLHRNDPPGEVELRELEALRAMPGMRLVREAPDGLLFEPVPSPDRPDPLPDLATGWHEMGLWEGREPFRWAAQEGVVRVDALRGGAAVLSFDARPFLAEPGDVRRLEIVVNGETLGQYTLGEGWTQARVDAALEPGVNEIVLRTLEPAVSPLKAGHGGDPRPLAFGVKAVRIAYA